MLTTATISMMLSNTATTAMMVQIVQVILAELEKGMRREIRADTDEDEQQETQIGNSTEYTVLQDEVESEICPEVPQDFDHREFVKKAVRYRDIKFFVSFYENWGHYLALIYRVSQQIVPTFKNSQHQ